MALHSEGSPRIARAKGSRRQRLAGFSLAAIAMWAGACGPSPEEVRLGRAMHSTRHELRPDYADSLGILDKYRQNPAQKSNCVMYGMCEVSLATVGGNLSLADKAAKDTFMEVQKSQDIDAEKAAAAGNEAAKLFKGEPHERALLAFYAGLACYINAQYNDARIFFMQSLLASTTRDDDMADFREDFQLGHFWLGRTYMKMEQEDNSRIAFSKAAIKLSHKTEDAEIKKLSADRTAAFKQELKGEELCYKDATTSKTPIDGVVDLAKGCSRSELPASLPGAAEADPTQLRAETLEAFLDRGFQAEVNLIIVIEMGQGPIKYLTGNNAAYDEYLRVNYRERSADVYIDGHRSGPAFCLLDTYHQAVTRGVKTRRDRQTGKAVTKEILSHMPYIGNFAAYWDIRGDSRYWTSLPGEVQLFAAKVTPGLHTITLKFCDINGQYLPRYDVTRNYIAAPAEGEAVLVMYSLENQDNAYLLTLRPVQ